MENNLFITTYLAVFFKNKNEYAEFTKEFETQEQAEKFIDEIKQNYYCIVLRKEQKYIHNNENTDIAVSSPIKSYYREEKTK